jgi:acyl-coenzyme A thioesterase PaaI-like protein
MSEIPLPPPPTLDEIRQAAQQAGYFQLLDLHIENAQDGTGTTRISVDARLYHAHQFVHGGVLFTLADTAMAMAIMSVLPAGTRFSPTFRSVPLHFAQYPLSSFLRTLQS